MNYLANLADGDEAFQKTFTGILKSEFTADVAAYECAISGHDYESARQAVHKLKHKIGLLGMVKSYSQAQGFEDQLRAGNDQLKDWFGALLIQLQGYLNTLES